MIEVKQIRHYTSRKFLGYLLTSGILVISALIVKNNNFPALATALVMALTAFTAGNTVSGLLPGGTPQNGTVTTATVATATKTVSVDTDAD